MYKIILFAGMILVLVVSCCLAQEEITITSYYPSPYGMYDSMATDRIGVGDTDGSGGLDSADVPTTSGDAWIDGNVGIGDVAPDGKFEVNPDNTEDSGDEFVVNSSGDVGIGTSWPNYRLEAATDASNDYVANFFNDGNNQNRQGIRIQAGADGGTGSTNYISCYDGDGDNIGYIENQSGTFQLVDPSDIRTKTNIADTMVEGLSVINNLRVVDFNRIQNPEGPRSTGFIAQEAQEVYPKMVTTGPDGMLGVGKASLIPVLVEAMQEQQKQIEDLRETIEDLKTQIRNGDGSV